MAILVIFDMSVEYHNGCEAIIRSWASTLQIRPVGADPKVFVVV